MSFIGVFLYLSCYSSSKTYPSVSAAPPPLPKGEALLFFTAMITGTEFSKNYKKILTKPFPAVIIYHISKPMIKISTRKSKFKRVPVGAMG